GSSALDYLNNLNLPDVARLPIGRAMTSFLLGDNGEVVCEAYVIALGDAYMLLTEGCSVETVQAYLQANTSDYSVTIENVTSEIGLIGLDGPFTWELLKDIIGVKILGLRYLEMLENQKLGNASAHIIRAGKTGEFGYLLMVSADQVADCWNGLLTAGAKYHIQPIGAATLDLCRLENRFPNMRLEGTQVANPLELNCRVMFDREKDNHKGREAIEALLGTGPTRRLIGFCVEGSTRVPNVGDKVLVDDQVIGEVANAQFSHGLEQPIGLALMNTEFAFVGIAYKIQSGDETLHATTVSAPFISNRSMTIRPQEDSYFN
ncbi:MAG: aminomethyl transferase family protein, partial [Pirellulaceae bacterium]|nr:aminomethyl transferase family protein [Pirellulaceae bacterium]